jgi:hypothetical protein
MAGSRDDLKADLRTKLEQVVRDRIRVKGEKKEADDAFNDELKKLDEKMNNIIQELDDCYQLPLPFGEEAQRA